MRGAELSPAMPTAARPPRPRGVPVERGWPHRCGRPDALPRPSPRPPPPPDGRREGGGDGAEREEAAEAAGGNNAASFAGGLVGSGAEGVVVARMERGSGGGGGGGGGELKRKRGLEPATRPPPKRRAVSAKRQFPPGCGRDAAALIAGGGRGGEDGLRLGAAPSYGGFGALEKAAASSPARSGGSEEDGLLLEATPANAGLGVLEVAAADGGAPMVDGYHGPEAAAVKLSDALGGNAVAIADDLLENGAEGVAGSVVEERGRGTGSGELGRAKELVPIAPLLPKWRMVSAMRRFPPSSGRDVVAPLAGEGGGGVGLQLEAVPTDGGLVVSKGVVAMDGGGSVVGQCAMDIVGALSKGALDGTEGEELEEGEVAPEVHHEVRESPETAGVVVLDDSASGRHEALARYASDETKCVEGLQREGKDSAQAAQNDLLMGSKCRMSLLAAADKFSEGGPSNGIIQGKRVWGSNGMNGEPLGLSVGDSGSGTVKSKIRNMEKPSMLIQRNMVVNSSGSEADGCLAASSIAQVHGQDTSNGIADGQELEEGEVTTEADHVVQESHVAVNVIPHESTDGRHEGAVPAIRSAEPSMGHFSDEKICGNTLQREGKSAAWAVAEDVKVMNKVLRGKMVCTPRKSVPSPVKANQKSPLDTSHRFFSKGKEESATTIRESFAPRKKMEVKGPARSKHLPMNVASTSALVSTEKLKDKEASNLEDDDILKALAVHEGKLELYLNVPACVPSVSRHRQHGGLKADARSEVRMMCRRFQFICRFLVQAVEQRSLKIQRVDLAADKVIRKLPGFIKHGPLVGKVPGVEVGDEFLYRVELAIVGLHRPYQGGIDTTKDDTGFPIAVSIVASGGYPDELSSSGELIYTGSGGKPAGKKVDEDQKLERGNLALKNCIEKKTPVRVIHGFKGQNREESSHSRAKQISTFTYDGLYRVVDCWREGLPGSRVFKYRLQRIPEQPELPLQIAKVLRKSIVRPGLCIADISQGKERIPICVINNVDNVRPAAFKYITRIKYPSLPTKRRPQGCGCTNGCSDSVSCACAVKNGEIPFNFNGAVVHAKPLIFECGPSCSCPSSCHNRVSQHGMKIPLEVFRTTKTGWGVRSLRSISSGSFICEYVGELLHVNEAGQRRNGEYLFDVGHNYDDEDLWKGLLSVTPGLNSSGPFSQTMEDVRFTIDAAEYGNVGRFINHSCSPNLYSQNVLWDHDDQRMPHIMFFAAENIPPLQELTYDYNYKIDRARDVNGRVKAKHCDCGSTQCCGRLY